ncbi:unnamed protein product [Amoebophrya sp. A120]|nr:unnamed protein product [Amoebophrya sp. A120]|eukprot:GSA120T00011542001.1
MFVFVNICNFRGSSFVLLWSLLLSLTVSKAAVSYDFALHFVDLDFVIAGFPQSGTSSLVYYLRQHPEIFVSDEFEDNMFWRANYTATSFHRWRRKYSHRGEPKKKSRATKVEVDADNFVAGAGAAHKYEALQQARLHPSSQLEGEINTEEKAFLFAEEDHDAPVSKSQEGPDTTTPPVVRLLGLKDPLLGFTPEAMKLLGERVKLGCKIIFLIRDPLEMLISWLQGGASWLTPWNTLLHLGAGYFLEHLAIAKELFKKGQTVSLGARDALEEQTRIEQNFLFVPTHQLLKNTDDVLGKILQFLGLDPAFKFDTRKKLHVGYSTRAVHQPARFSDAAQASRKRATGPDKGEKNPNDPSVTSCTSSSSPAALTKQPFFLPHQLDVCGLNVLPFLQAAFEGQQEQLTTLLADQTRKNSISFERPYFAPDSHGIPKQCLNHQKRITGRGPSSSFGVSSPSSPRRTQYGFLAFNADRRPRQQTRRSRKRQRYIPLRYALPQCRAPLANIAIEPMKHMVLRPSTDELREHSHSHYDVARQAASQFISVPFLYGNVPRTRRPDVCNSLKEVREYIPSSILDQLDCHLQLSGTRVMKGSTTSAISLDEQHGAGVDHDGRKKHEASDLCSKCCIFFSAECWDDENAPKLPKCCIQRLSMYLSVVSYLLRMEICGQDMGCSGVRKNFVTMENLN